MMECQGSRMNGASLGAPPGSSYVRHYLPQRKCTTGPEHPQIKHVLFTEETSAQRPAPLGLVPSLRKRSPVCVPEANVSALPHPRDEKQLKVMVQEPGSPLPPCHFLAVFWHHFKPQFLHLEYEGSNRTYLTGDCWG